MSCWGLTSILHGSILFFVLLAGCLPSAVGSLLVWCLLYFLGKKSWNQCSCTCLPSQSNFNWTHHCECFLSFFLKGKCFTSTLQLASDLLRDVPSLYPYGIAPFPQPWKRYSGQREKAQFYLNIGRPFWPGYYKSSSQAEKVECHHQSVVIMDSQKYQFSLCRNVKESLIFHLNFKIVFFCQHILNKYQKVIPKVSHTLSCCCIFVVGNGLIFGLSSGQGQHLFVVVWGKVRCWKCRFLLNIQMFYICFSCCLLL